MDSLPQTQQQLAVPAPSAAVSSSQTQSTQPLEPTNPGPPAPIPSPIPDASLPSTTQTDASQSQFQSAPPAPATPPAPRSFIAALELASIGPNSIPYVQPPEYIPPPVPAGPDGPGPVATGIVRTEAGYKIVPDDEMKGPATWGQGKKWIEEDKVKLMSVTELKKMGLGRGSTGYCYSSRMTLHKPIPATENESDGPHPEQPKRIIGVFKKLEAAGLTARMQRVAVREAVKEEIELVHSPGHWERVRGTGYQTIEYLESCSEYFDRISLYINQESAICARLSCGGVIEMCRAVAEGQIRNGFAIVRPPGHHAEPEDAMGFCFFNNAAVAAKWLRTVYDGHQAGPGASGSEGLKMNKILILDWDVHHGNGTQKAFWDDKNVLYMSLHRHDGVFYPGGAYGGPDMVGGAGAEGYSVNIPFPEAGMKDADYIYAFQQVVMPIAYEFNPDFVIVSAGYDAADGDTLGRMKVSPEGFAHMTHMLSVLANGKLVLALEGGYNVEAIASSALACVEVLLGDEPRHLVLEAASMSATNAVQDVIRMQSKYWKCMGFNLESAEELTHAGKPIPISEILKAHRTYELYHKYFLYNIEFADPRLEEAYKDQLLCSEDVYDCTTLLVFMHDLGAIKASFSAATLDVNLEKTILLDTSREVLDWARDRTHGKSPLGVIDVNFLAHLPTVRGQPPDTGRDQKLERELALHIWDNLVSISTAKNIILFGSGCGCSALMNIIQSRPAVRERVKACISVLGFEVPPELDSASGLRNWYKENSLVMLPSSHPLNDDARRTGKHQKKYGNIYRSTAEEEGRPTHLLKASLRRIKDFIAERIPSSTIVDSGASDVEMSNGEN